MEILDRTSEITIITDSKYVEWHPNLARRLEKNNWKTASKKPVKNEELWKRLDLLCKQHEVNWKWVKGHAGDMGNERVDKLARSAMEPFKKD